MSNELKPCQLKRWAQVGGGSLVPNTMGYWVRWRDAERLESERDEARRELAAARAEIARLDAQIGTLRDMHAADAKEIARLNAVIAAQAEAKGGE